MACPSTCSATPVDDGDVAGDATFGQVPAERPDGDLRAIARTASLLADARMPIFICGGGVVTSGAEDVLQSLVERLDAPVATTITGQGAIAETHPLALGVVGSNGGTPETRAVVERADLVVFVTCRAGSVTTERWQYPAAGKAKIVQIDIDPNVIGATYEPDAAIVGDVRLILEALLV